MESNNYICTAQTNLTLKDDLIITREAEERGVSKSQLIRDIIEEWISNEELRREIFGS